MEKLRLIVEENNTTVGRYFDLSLQFLIVVSLISFSVETLPDLNAEQKNILNIIEVVTVLIFTVEYLLRVIVSQNKVRFIFSFFGLIDFFAILPFYISTGVDLRTIRAFRLLRLFRAFKLLRYSQAVKRFRKALLIAKEELILFFCTTLVLLYISAVGIYFFENAAQPKVFSSIFESLWWAVATLTTVGYGDIYPITAGGKFFTFLILMIGLGIIAVPTGLFASALAEARQNDNDEE